MRFEMRFVRGHVEVYDGEGRFLFLSLIHI